MRWRRRRAPASRSPRRCVHDGSFGEILRADDHPAGSRPPRLSGLRGLPFRRHGPPGAGDGERAGGQCARDGGHRVHESRRLLHLRGRRSPHRPRRCRHRHEHRRNAGPAPDLRDPERRAGSRRSAIRARAPSPISPSPAALPSSRSSEACRFICAPASAASTEPPSGRETACPAGPRARSASRCSLPCSRRRRIGAIRVMMGPQDDYFTPESYLFVPGK